MSQKLQQAKYEQRDKAALEAFLKDCKAVAQKKGKLQIASISIKTQYMDPLAVLESVYDKEQPFFYLEHEGSEFAMAGAEQIVGAEFSGAQRFDQVKAFAKGVLENTIVLGDMDSPCSGPHFFTNFTFEEEVSKGAQFAAARVFLPRWQVAKSQGAYTAVANIPVMPDMPIEPLVEKVWQAHEKFQSFDYGNRFKGECCCEILSETTVGQGYENAVGNAVEKIVAGELDKVVLARALDLESDGEFDAFSSLNRLRESYPTCFPCAVSNGKGQVFLGAGPERLALVRDGRAYTEAVSGTVKRGSNASEDAKLGQKLLSSEKDRAEQRKVLDFIDAKLKAMGLKPEYVEEPRLKKLANVQHLYTPVECDLPQDMHFLDIAKQLHPTPAVGGVPLEKAMDVIRDSEAFERGLYAGVMGYFDYQGQGELVVGLRSAIIDGSKARLYAGAGIVAGSDPEAEFQETEVKFKAMKEHLR